METVARPVQNSRGRRRWWTAEQKLAVLQEWHTQFEGEQDEAAVVVALRNAVEKAEA